MARRVLFLGAHPDDADFSCGGTAALLRQRGDAVTFCAVTNGNKGHFAREYVQNPNLLAARRRAEGERAAAVIGARFMTLDVPDGEVYVTPALMEALVRLIRREQPDLVVLNRPNDYHRDHRYTAQAVLDSAYLLTVPMFCSDVAHLERMPVLAYWWDRFSEGSAFRPDVVVPIDAVLEVKAELAAAHASQFFEWLPYNAGTLEQVPPDAAGRRAYVLEHLQQRGARVLQDCRERLGGDLWPGAQCAEAFQISEYGRQPSHAELRELFPVTMLPGSAT